MHACVCACVSEQMYMGVWSVVSGYVCVHAFLCDMHTCICVYACVCAHEYDVCVCVCACGLCIYATLYVCVGGVCVWRQRWRKKVRFIA